MVFEKGHKTWNKGINTPNWAGGKSFEPYAPEFNRNLKNKLKEQYHYVCQLCERLIKNYSKNLFLTIHHIDYNKQNNSLKNLIPLCNSCNSKVNYRRTEWEDFFRNKIIKVINET